jgi:hypothetical protein
LYAMRNISSLPSIAFYLSYSNICSTDSWVYVFDRRLLGSQNKDTKERFIGLI